MRLAIQNLLWVLALLLILLAGLAFWVNRWLHAALEAATTEAASLVSEELAVTIEGIASGELLDDRPAARRRLYARLHELAAGSELVRSIAVVDRDGKVLASDEFLEIGDRFENAGELFANSLEPLLRSEPAEDRTVAENQLLLVPLTQAGAVAGYLRVALESARIPSLAQEARRLLWAAAIFGGLALVVLGVSLHVQLSRSGERLARTLEAVRRGELSTPGARDEFSRAFQIARELGREMQQIRDESDRVRGRLAVLSAALDTGVVLLRASGEMEFADRRALELLGGGDEGRAAERIGEAWRRLSVRTEAESQRLQSTRSLDLEVESPDGARRVRLDLGGPGLDDGRLIVVKDLDLIEALETDLRSATQLRALAGLMVGVVHDLKAPLNAMRLNLELLRSAIDKRSAAEATESGRGGSERYFEILNGELERLDRSLGLLLANTIPGPQREETVELGELLREIEALLAPQARRQRITVETRVPDGAVKVELRRDRLKQAILNIALNGLEAMPAGGDLRLTLAAERGRAEIEIVDTGPGIADEVLPRIWDMHFTTKSTGTGVGLHVARGNVESCGGEIRVETELGRGTRFRVSLPLADEEV